MKSGLSSPAAEMFSNAATRFVVAANVFLFTIISLVIVGSPQTYERA
jgi:hypothetical protein